MRVTDSKNSLQNVQSVAVTGILGWAPVPPPHVEGPERLLVAVRASFDRLFQPGRHWTQVQRLGYHPQSFRFNFPSQSVVNPFAVIQGAYGQTFEKLEAAKKPLKPHQQQKLKRPKDSLVQWNKGRAGSLRSEVQTLFSEADRLSCSGNPEDRVRANQAKLKASQILQTIAQLNRQAQLNHQARSTKFSYY